MLIDFFYTLKDAKIPVSIKEFLTLLEALDKGLISMSMDDFYFLSRTIMVKDEAYYDKFDKAFGLYFKGIETIFEKNPEIPLEWLAKRMERELTDEQKAALEKFGYDKLMDRLQELLKEQKERHEGGNKWIGTGGTSPFGNGGQNPEGIRIGGKGGNRTAVKVWEARAFRDYDDERELGTRNIKIALRRLRKFARHGAEDELALDATIKATANNAGYLDIKMQPERKNNIKVLMLLDVGGTMDDHIARTEELFSAAKTEFKNMEFFYFHNCVYDHLWKNNRRRHAEKFPTWDVLRKYTPDTKVIFVGDATMSPYEILQAGGSVEYNNEEAGAAWLQRFTSAFPKFIWLNPEPEGLWQYRQSVSIIKQIMNNRMFPVTIEGLERGMRLLSK
ncbi:VWA domain-containing protein [Undibacterium sp. RTI2.1]|uniref:vWA domain-containing protein n=1 Tax=unclassified Undibacterium TaxID=2630295 RepID=UPI002AB4B124|nr:MULTISPECIES: VWA domain-containing protein [unclassified Undibacterium]MDY7536885.1 VWA domain-containing protein [Undibacterium sp. 5I1]MEB0031685.1 VWA domain-containing protein [Undibacterium sp. RTI2.1]MEB0117956.1 VWA domain-containing protein [Undibacterium sp. RTI2.2]MEB0230390.1 VWA domain-containing protein [Undibacterium sp. 10I3]MEB0258808.1 VWA domain-containing protein [Undibacterium sp. 5I1]